MTSILERHQNIRSTEATMTETPIRARIDRSLAKAETFSDEEIDRNFAALVLCATQVGIVEYVKADEIDEFVEVIPNAADLIVKIHDVANTILETETLDADSLTTIKDLGVAADITQSHEILEKTIQALGNTQDQSIATIKRALEIAQREEQLFTEVYANIRSGSSTIAAAARELPMSQRPDFPESDPLAKYLSARTVAMPKKYDTHGFNAAAPVNQSGQPATVEEIVLGMKKDPSTGLFNKNT